MPSTGSSHPLIIMLHGFGNDKHEWESTTDEGDGADKYHWNNRWFAKHGYYVLSYTARGFSDDGPSEDTSQPPRPAIRAAPWSLPDRGIIHLKSRDYEIRDTQWLAALVAATYRDVDPTASPSPAARTAASRAGCRRARPPGRSRTRSDPSLPVLSLQVAVAKYPSTDLAYSLAPERPRRRPGHDRPVRVVAGPPGRATQGDGNPVGVPKESYINGLFALGQTKGIFEPGTSNDPPFPCTYGDCEGRIRSRLADPHGRRRSHSGRATRSSTRSGAG